MPTKFKITVTHAARVQLKKIKDRRVLEKLVQRIDDLALEPEKQGKALVEELAGCRSLRAVGQRYRIVYRVEENKVAVIAVGIRKKSSRQDIYHLAKKLFKIKLLE
jgi:mRNA interferase RelE/StbE